MKQAKYNFQWFEKEDRRKALRASVGKDGKLRMGKPLRNALPRFIHIGFDPKVMVLAIADGHGVGIDCPACGILTAQALSAQISSTGLCLPVSFRLTPDERTGFFLGRVIPRRRQIAGSKKKQYDTDQLLILYQYIVDNATSHQAKSTPFPERKAAAVEAFCSAVRNYQPGYGDLEAYLEHCVNHTLLSVNKQYVAAYPQRSLDQPFSPDSENPFCLYDTLALSNSGGIDAVEDRIMAEQFWDTLFPNECALLQMLQDGRSIPQIAAKLRLSVEAVQAMGLEIGQKRRLFYNAT